MSRARSIITAAAAAGLLCGSTASAQPIGWVKVRQTAYTMRLPKDWTFLGRKFTDAKKKYLGTWRYASPSAQRKFFMRVTELDKKDTLAAAFDKGIANLRRKAKGLKPVGKPVIRNVVHGDLIVASFQGVLNVRDPATKQVKPVKHQILRMMQRFPGSGLEATGTYLFAGDNPAELQEFFRAHLRTIHVVKSERELHLARLLAKSKKRKPPRLKTDPQGEVLTSAPK